MTEEHKKTDEEYMEEDFEETVKIAKENFPDVGEVEERFGKESFGLHELGDRSCIVYENFQTYVMGHPTLSLDKELFEKAWKVNQALADFYQEAACWGVDWEEDETEPLKEEINE